MMLLPFNLAVSYANVSGITAHGLFIRKSVSDELDEQKSYTS